MLNVVCVKWGTLYGPEYVNILRDMVWRNLSVPHRFICFTDDPTGIVEGVETRPLPGNLKGWWNKLYLFKPGVLEGRVLFFDLDTIISGDLEKISEYQGDFAILRDFYRPNGYGSGVMMWNKPHHYIWEKFEEAGFPEISGGDQAWIEKVVEKADRWQDLFPKAFVSYKVHCQNWPPQGSKVICFHGNPRPHHYPSKWIEEIWKVGGLKEAKFIPGCNVTDETLLEHAKINTERKIPWMMPHPVHNRKALLVCGGPSLSESLQEIRKKKKRGFEIWCVNNTHDWLLDRGIKPDHMVLLDAREQNVKFLQDPQKGVNYWLASQCHPKSFDVLEGYSVILWHSNFNGADDWYNETHPNRPWCLIGGGGTVGLRTLYLLHQLGYRLIHVIGMDGSYREGKHHAYDQSLNDGERLLEVTAGEKKFTCSPWMVRQAQDFQIQAKTLHEHGVTLRVFGDGLIPHIANHR